MAGSTSRLVGLLALIPPAIALACTYWALATYEPGPSSSREAREAGNAGLVVNGTKHNEGAVAYMETQLATHQPQVLILGNSYANTNLDPNQIAAALGLRPSEVLTLSVPNSVSSHWYAILQHRVYDAGYSPPLVLIVGGLQSLLTYDPYSEASYEDLMVQLDSREPVLGKYIDLSHPQIRKLARNRVLFRDVGLNSLRDSVLDLFFDGGPEANTAALEQLFSDENLDMSRHVTAGGQATVDDDSSVEGLPTPKDSMIEDLARMMQTNGSTLVYIRTPMLNRTPNEKMDQVPDSVKREVDAIFKRYGHVFLDLYELQLPLMAFKNARHLSPEGARIFTAKVDETLVQIWGEDHRAPGTRLRGFQQQGDDQGLGGGRFRGGRRR